MKTRLQMNFNPVLKSPQLVVLTACFDNNKLASVYLTQDTYLLRVGCVPRFPLQAEAGTAPDPRDSSLFHCDSAV